MNSFRAWQGAILGRIRPKYKKTAPICLPTEDLLVPVSKTSTLIGRSIAGRSQLKGSSVPVGSSELGADSKTYQVRSFSL